MRTGRPKAMLTMSNDERTHLLAITRSRSLPAALTLRAKIVLACEREPSNAIVATRLDVGPHTIGKWRNRFIADRIEGLYDEMRTGRPCRLNQTLQMHMLWLIGEWHSNNGTLNK